MSKSWLKYYEQLASFINEEAMIEIGEKIVSIDETVREEFYKKFNEVRQAFVAREFTEWLDESNRLSSRYIKVEGELEQLLHLEAVMMPAPLKRFLSDPLKQVIRDLFDPLFDLIKGKIEPVEFEEKAYESVKESFKDLYQRGFIKWFVLNLIMKIEPKKNFEVPLPKPTSKQLIKHRKDIQQNVPFPLETNLLRFEVERSDILLAPDFIISSSKFNKYIAFRTELGKALWRASYYSQKREWFVISSLIEKYEFTDLKPDLLIYIDENLEDISLVADCEKICRPEISIFFMDRFDFKQKNIAKKMNEILLTHKIIAPVKGTIVFVNNHLPGSMTKVLDENIKFIEFGLDKMNWDLIINLLQE